jgi:hypothetical protein
LRISRSNSARLITFPFTEAAISSAPETVLSSAKDGETRKQQHDNIPKNFKALLKFDHIENSLFLFDFILKNVLLMTADLFLPVFSENNCKLRLNFPQNTKASFI